MLKPKTFPGQNPDETIHLFLRKHWLAFLPTMVLTFIMLLVPIFVFLALRMFAVALSDFQNVIVLGTSCYLLFVLAFFITSFVDYYLDIAIITNQRIIDIDQRGLFDRIISEQNLVRVQDASAKAKGILQTFFKYGTVAIQTAGEFPNFDFEFIPNPYEVAQKIMELHRQSLAMGYQEIGEKPRQEQDESNKGEGNKEEITEQKLKEGIEIEIKK